MQLDGAYSAPASPGQLLEEPRPDADGGICECLGCGLVLIIICALSTLAEVRNTKRGGLLMLAPPCSTWIFLTLDTEVELLLVFLASIAEPFVCLRMLYVFFSGHHGRDTSQVFAFHTKKLGQPSWRFNPLCRAGQHFGYETTLCVTRVARLPFPFS